MSLFLEWKKQKRTGYVTAYAGCGLLAAAFPLINTGVRPETFLSLPGNPLDLSLIHILFYEYHRNATSDKILQKLYCCV